MINNPRLTVAGAASVAILSGALLVGCGNNADTTPSPTPTPSPTQTTATPTASPTPTPTPTSAASKYSIRSGSFALVKGLGAGRWPANGGTMTVAPYGSGVLSGAITVAAKGDAAKGDWILNLKTDRKGNVLSGSLTSPGVQYKVTGPGGSINYLTTGSGTTLVTVKPIPVQDGTTAPTTMTLSIVGQK